MIAELLPPGSFWFAAKNRAGSKCCLQTMIMFMEVVKRFILRLAIAAGIRSAERSLGTINMLAASEM